MEINPIITLAGTLTTAFITSMAAPYYLNFYLKKKFQKLQYMIDAFPLIQNVQDDFRDNFITSTIQENTFFVMTGIRTNYQSIPAYIELKNKLGKNFDWPFIKSAKPHLSFDEAGSLYVNLSKSLIYFKNFSICSALLLALIGFAILVFSNNAELDTFSIYIILYIFAAMSFLLAYIVMASITSILDAGIIAKRLTAIENTSNLNIQASTIS